MAKKRMYSFAKEKHSGKGILSTILGTLSLVIFAVLAWLAYYLDGQGGVYLGSIGLRRTVPGPLDRRCNGLGRIHAGSFLWYDDDISVVLLRVVQW